MRRREDMDGWMGSVNKQQLVGCWLGYSTADARLFLEFEMCSSVGFFLGGGGRLQISTTQTQLCHMQNATRLKNKCTLGK